MNQREYRLVLYIGFVLYIDLLNEISWSMQPMGIGRVEIISTSNPANFASGCRGHQKDHTV